MVVVVVVVEVAVVQCNIGSEPPHLHRDTGGLSVMDFFPVGSRISGFGLEFSCRLGGEVEIDKQHLVHSLHLFPLHPTPIIALLAQVGTARRPWTLLFGYE